jgi:hypothetical protein
VIILTLVSWLGWIPPLTYVRPDRELLAARRAVHAAALAVGYRSSR